MSFSLSSNSDETAIVCDVPEGTYYIANQYVAPGLEGTVYSLAVLLSEDFGLGYISGYVTDEWESPIEGATVELYGAPFDWHLTRPLVTTDSDGFYKIAWAPGDYTVRFNQTDFNDTESWTPEVNYIGKMFNYGEVKTLSQAEPLQFISETLEAGAAISGQVTDGTGAPVANAIAYAHAGDFASQGSARSDEYGHYLIDRLRTGNFAVRFRTPPGGTPLINEWYDDKALFSSAAVVGVDSLEGETGDIHAALDEKTWGTISGHVTDAGGNPVFNLSVVIYDPAGLSLWSTKTDTEGNYAISRVPAGSWKVGFNAASISAPNLVTEYYPDVRLLKDAGTVAVAAGEMTSGIDASLAAAGTITGQVNNNVGNLNVIAFDTAADFSLGVAPAISPIGGPATYILKNLPPGAYRVVAKPNQQGDRIPHWYPDATSFAAAGTVTVVAGATVPGVDITLPGGGGMIYGRVTDIDDNGIAGVTVVAQDATKATGYASALTTTEGEYVIRQVPAGQVKVYFNADAGRFDYVSEYNNDKSTHALANAVAVVEGETTTVPDAALAYRDALAVTTTSLPPGEVAIPYSAQLAATGGRPFYRWTNPSGALPDGLVLSSKGEITGVPTTTGVFDFVVEVSDSTAPEQKSEIGFMSITVGEYTGEGYTLTGMVTELGSGLPGVTLTGLPGSPVTNSAGAYVAVVPSGWSGTVTPLLTGYAFEPATRPYGNVSADLSDQDYAASAGYRISGTVTLAGVGHSGVLMAGLARRAADRRDGRLLGDGPAGRDDHRNADPSGVYFLSGQPALFRLWHRSDGAGLCRDLCRRRRRRLRGQ